MVKEKKFKIKLRRRGKGYNILESHINRNGGGKQNISVNVFSFHPTRQLPIKSVKKIGKYKFHICHTKCYTWAPSSTCSKWNQLKILALKINIIIQEPLSMESCIVSLATNNGTAGYNINVSFITALKYGRFWTLSSFTMDFSPTDSLISASTFFMAFRFAIKAVIAQIIVAALVSVPATMSSCIQKLYISHFIYI
ncbi:hypothetical protein H5410_049247 [Solanum commersonii]|uniref:Uncharacterized protein n=1 Tax=Solanum commersonii TaxID=4109 RepID=A0A9J5XLT1_SOLCO|nr:hypothetical protein H5410_049247 [Solanum commersonii]